LHHYLREVCAYQPATHGNDLWDCGEI
jgi:hypothetical protein